MPVFRSQVPQEVLRAFHAGVDDFLEAEDPVREKLRQAEIIGIPTFSLKLDELVRESRPLNVIPTGWRVLAMDSDGALLLSADIARHSDGVRFASISRDPRAADFATQLKRADELAPQPDERFDLTLLRIPGVLVEVFVLAPQDGSAAVIVPIRAPDETLRLMKRHTVEELVSTITKRQEPQLPSLIERFRQFDKVSIDDRPAQP